MISSLQLQGVFPAIPTPVTATGAIDVAAVDVLMNGLVKGGVDGVVPLGGTGEYGALARAQRVRMVDRCAKVAAGRLPVIAGVLDPGFHDALSAANAFASAGADAMMVVTPYYTNPTQHGIRDYFLRIADGCQKPIIIYEIPYRTRVSIEPAILHELSRHENIIGMKACNTDMYHFLQVTAGVSDDFAVLSGEDTLFPLHMAAGASGGIIVTSTLLPRTWGEIYRRCTSGKLSEAIALHRRLIPFLNHCFGETNPGPMKSVWDLIGIDSPHVLLPLETAATQLSTELREELSNLLQEEKRYISKIGVPDQLEYSSLLAQ